MGVWKAGLDKKGVGVKGKSGRKTRGEEVEKLREKLREEVTQEMLVKLANRIIYKRLSEIETSKDKIKSSISSKEFAMPITLKGMTEKQETKVDSTIEIVNYADTLQLQPKTIPTTDTSSDGPGIQETPSSLAS